MQYGTYNRQAPRRITDGTQDKVRDSFDEAWKEGKRWSIVLEDDGSVRVRVGTKTVQYYRDANDFAKSFFPELAL
jgi:hypothetical protein